MKAMSRFPNRVKHSSKALSESELKLMEYKLHDKEYLEHAIYRLASILCDQLLQIGEETHGTVEK